MLLCLSPWTGCSISYDVTGACLNQGQTLSFQCKVDSMFSLLLNEAEGLMVLDFISPLWAAQRPKVVLSVAHPS